MLIRTLDFHQQFHCLAGSCPHSCCEKWEIVLDDEHIRQYRATPGPLGEKLRNTMETDADGDVCFTLNSGRCPFLDQENLCEIHRQLGESATSITCQEHPRFTEDYGSFQEITLSASCPAANALLLGSELPLTIAETVTDTPEEAGDPWLDWLLPLRQHLISLLQNRSQSLHQRMHQFLMSAQRVQGCLDQDIYVTADVLQDILTSSPADTFSPSVLLFPQAFSVLEQLEILDPDWLPLLRKAAAVPTGTFAPETLLERIAVYLSFRYLLKAVNDGDFLGRAQLVVLGVLLIERLSAVCGISEALRHFSCEIEHSEENLLALADAFQYVPVLSVSAMLHTLSS